MASAVRISFWFEADPVRPEEVILVAVRDGEGVERCTWVTMEAAIERAKQLIERTRLQELA